jgi:hypothetical protein
MEHRWELMVGGGGGVAYTSALLDHLCVDRPRESILLSAASGETYLVTRHHWSI